MMFFYPEEDTLKIYVDIMNDIFLPQGRYPENFMLISQLEMSQEGGSRTGVLGGH